MMTFDITVCKVRTIWSSQIKKKRERREHYSFVMNSNAMEKKYKVFLNGLNVWPFSVLIAKTRWIHIAFWHAFDYFAIFIPWDLLHLANFLSQIRFNGSYKNQIISIKKKTKSKYPFHDFTKVGITGFLRYKIIRIDWILLWFWNEKGNVKVRSMPIDSPSKIDENANR